METTTTTEPMVTRIPIEEPIKKNYVEFNTYIVTPPTSVRLDRVVMYYNGGDLISSIGQNYFPFVSVVMIGRGKEKKPYYRLMNTRGEIVFTTDEDGMTLLYSLKDGAVKAEV
jgi:hypothetical protein